MPNPLLNCCTHPGLQPSQTGKNNFFTGHTPDPIFGCKHKYTDCPTTRLQFYSKKQAQNFPFLWTNPQKINFHPNE
jgi:hypothetical protein